MTDYRFVKTTSYYKEFLDYYYRNNSSIITKSYREQYKDLMNQKFSWADFFQTNFNKLGIEAYEIITNALSLQKAWAIENDLSLGKDIFIHQLKKIRPEVLFIQDFGNYSLNYLKFIRDQIPSLKFITTYVCSPYSKSIIKNLGGYDLILTCLPSFDNNFKNMGLESALFYHAFEASILNSLKTDLPKETDIIFMGSLFTNADFHINRLDYLNKLIRSRHKVKVYGNIQRDNFISIKLKQSIYLFVKLLSKIGLDALTQKFKLLRKFSILNHFPKKVSISNEINNFIISKPLFGIDMYQELSNSKIGFNIHGGIAGNYAANMRMFETTGVGSLLLTDHKENLSYFFNIDEEIVTYKSVEECMDKINWLLSNYSKLKEIAEAGQKKTLKVHSLENRIIQLHEIISKSL